MCLHKTTDAPLVRPADTNNVSSTTLATGLDDGADIWSRTAAKGLLMQSAPDRTLPGGEKPGCPVQATTSRVSPVMRVSENIRPKVQEKYGDYEHNFDLPGTKC